MSRKYPNNRWRWIFCCYCFERDTYNKIGDNYYEYGKFIQPETIYSDKKYN